MTKLLTLGYVLSGLATALAWGVARSRAEHRPIALLLTLGIASDLARRALRIWVLQPGYAGLAGAPATGWLRAAAHADAALFIAWPAGLAAASLAILLDRRPWGVGAVWALASLGLAASYPVTRGEVLQRFYLGAQLAGVIAAAGALIHWIIFRRNPPRFQHLAIMLAMSVDITALITGPWRTDIFAQWNLAEISYTALYAVLTVAQIGVLWKTRSSTS